MKLLLAMLGGILLGVGGYDFYYAHGTSYFTSDPRACANCHIMRDQFESWQKASHHAFATCGDCHMPHDFVGKWLTKASNGYHHSEAFTLQNFHEPIQIRPVNKAVLNAACLSCHGEFVSVVSAHGGTGNERLNCVRCHDAVGHGPSR